MEKIENKIQPRSLMPWCGRRFSIKGLLTRGLVSSFFALGLAVNAGHVSASEQNAKLEENKTAALGGKPTRFRDKTYLKRRWGVEVVHIRPSSAGYMLEFRYKVLDPEKAKPLTSRQTKPTLMHIESGAKLVVPAPKTTGPMRNTYDQVKGKTYWMLFGNPAKLVKSGDHVNIQIGKFRVNGLTVQ